MIERVARKLCELAMEPYDEISKKKYIADARAIIETMREIDDEMYDNYRCEKMWRDLNSKEVWQLWIDAALIRN